MSSSALSPKSTTPKKHWWSKPWSKKQRLTIASLGLLLIATGLGIGIYLHNQPSGSVAKLIPNRPSPTPEMPSIANPLNGELYTAAQAKEHANLRPMAVMVENHVESRPQSGLNQADVLYEGMAEGGITRFMALYLHHQPEKIGPVRSARQHFVDWAAEYDAIYAHWGGSAESLAFLRSNARPKDLDQFKFAGAFFRDYSGGKTLEHTGYTSMPQLRQVAQSQGWEETATFNSWAFKDEAVAEHRPQSHTVTIGFLGTFGYAAQFDYRPDTNDYSRTTGGQAHVDDAGQPLTAKTIILQFNPVTPYTDDGGHPAVRVQTNGSGKAVIIRDGIASEGVWTKAGRNDRTTYTTSDGQNIELNRGKIWVISAPTGSSVSY